MRRYRPRASFLDIYLFFKVLDTDKSQALSLEEFYKVYEVSELKWQKKHPDTPWYYDLGPRFSSKVFAFVHDVVVSKYFEALVYFVIALSTFYQLLEAATLPDYTYVGEAHYIESWIPLAFVCCE